MYMLNVSLKRMSLFIFQHPYFEGCKCLLGGAGAGAGVRPEAEENAEIEAAEIVTLESGPATGPHLCPTSGHGKSISVSDSDTPLHYRKAAYYIKSTIHALTSFKNSSRLL